MKPILALLLLFGSHAFAAHAFAERFEFEVAAVKQNKTGNGVSGGCRGIDSKIEANDARANVPLGRCWIAAGRLSHLMMIAYGVVQIQYIKGEPDLPWGSERFDIEGKAENPATATEAHLLLMLQSLLEDRFQLKIHREKVDISGSALVVARTGPKVKEAAGRGPAVLRISGAAISKFDAVDQKNLDQNMILGQKVTMAQLTNVLANLPASGPVIDATGLTGAYDFKLAWEPGESLSSVLEEQLGLRLQGQKVPVELLIIDSAQKPAEN
jgi:uncharacterized protein (TIGR03435 family)